MKRNAVALALSAFLIFACGESKEEKERGAREHKIQSPGRERKGGGEPGIVQLDAASQARAGIRATVLSRQSVLPQIAAYGKLEEDPSGSFVLRAPIAGILHTATGRAWPGIGQHVTAGARIGTIEPRFTPSERIGLNTQLAAAQADLSAATASITAARAAYERARILNADDKNVSDRVLQEAAARLRTEEARAQSAAATVRALETPLGRSLIAERGGDVVELLAQPGESIEPGSPILHLAKLDRLIARVDVPVGVRVAPNVSRAHIVAAGYEDGPPVEAERVAVGVLADTKTPGTSLLFRLLGTRFGFRPGLAVTAYLTVPGGARVGVVIPQSAVVQIEAKFYVYVQTAPARYERRPVSVGDPTAGGFFVTSGLQAGDRVVTVGAQTLLSEEFKSQLQHEEDEH